MRKKWFIWIGVALVVLVLLVLGFKQCSKAQKAMLSTMQSGGESYTVVRGDIVNKVEITGEIQPQTVVSLKSRVSGKIVKFYVNENEYVRSGQIIADIEPDYNQANTLFSTRAQWQQAEIRLRNARQDVEDKRQLLAQEYISREAFQDAEDELQAAEIAHQQASSQYEMIRDLDTGGRVTHVYATSSGVCIERKINEGEMVQSSITSYGEGTVIMKIADLSHMIVKSNINEVDIEKFSLGQSAEINLDALPYENFVGSITKISPQAITENNAKVFPIEISINATGEKVRPGMTANVSILGDTKENVLVVPIRAIFSNDNNEDIVYLLPSAPDSLATKPSAGKKPAKGFPAAPQGLPTPVRLGSNDMQQVEIIEGLKEGDKILLNDPNVQANPFQMMM
ncbi:MAG: efflux RND transporter periplasmic adaptor subunit [Candidatus Cloacimonadota bacterium]